MKTGTRAAKKTAFNVIMAFAAAVIVIGAVMIAGSLQGWFDGGGQTVQGGTAAAAVEAVTAENKTGSANIEREGIAYSLEDGTKLRDGDIIETLNGSSVELALPAGAVSLNQNTEAVVRIGEDGFSIELTNGEAFVNTDGAFTLRLAELETDVTAASGVFSASAPAGSANVYVYENSVSAGGIEVSAGQAVSLYADGQAPSVAALSLAALNDFDIGQVRAANETKTLCFTNGELDALAAEREEQLRSALEQQQAEQEIAQQIEEQRQNNQNGTGGSAGGTGSSAAGGASGSTGGSGSSGGASGGTGGSGSSGNAGNADAGLPANPTCTIAIRCNTILDHMEDLAEGKNKYVPANGTILAASTLEFSEGETVFDVLKRACSLAGIQLEYSWTPMYNSYYVEGIGNLYEFDCGNQSGWMYQVNGWYPNYGCSEYKVQNGDSIVWNYTCEGYGTDLGASMS